MERLNAEALVALTTKHNVQLREFPRDVVAGASRANDVLAELAARSDSARKVHDSYAAFRERRAVVAHLDQGGTWSARRLALADHCSLGPVDQAPAPA